MNDSATFKKDVAARLKRARKALKLTQEALCQRTGMRIPSLRDYELGKTIPGGEALSMLMRAGIAPAWVLTGTGEMFCKPAELVGAAIAGAIKVSKLELDDVVARLGVDIVTLNDYLQGRRMPGEALLVRVSEVTGYPLEKLLAARDASDALAQIEVLHARVQSTADEAAVKAGLSPEEGRLLACYDQADENGKALLLKIGAAVTNPSLKSWFDAGQALSEAARLFEPKR